MKRVCILGLGHIGLPTAILVAQSGYQVIGVDTDEDIVKMLNNGVSHLQEAGIDILLKDVPPGNLYAKKEPEEADAYIIAVPTPFDKDTKQADLKCVISAMHMISPFLRDYAIVIVESTIPPGVSERVLVPLLETTGLKSGKDFDLVYCPERAMPSNLVNEMVYNDRIIGAPNKRSANAAKTLYSSFVKGAIHVTTVRTAEMCKVIENVYRDVNIALANELALVAEDIQIDIWQAIELANKHPRVNILRPGPGVGGHCIAVDPWFLSSGSTPTDLIRAARRINERMPDHVIAMVKQIVNTDPPNIAVFGIAYKGNVDDYRESPSLRIIELAEDKRWGVKIYDPVVKKTPKYPLLELEEAVRDSDCIIIATDHDLFSNIDPVAIGPLMRQKNVIDTRNILDKETWQKAGFTHRLLGRGTKLC
ncbi:MAG: nucleotide sugar dehydrogenase [Halobacteriota archaeon]|jgi:UDP-N-acetyl-D-mannosaminuronic acid dehydrogenase